MIEFKNKIYNSKEYKKQKSFTKNMEIKKSIRIHTKSFFPLSVNEKILYEDEHNWSRETSKPTGNDFLYLTIGFIFYQLFPKMT